MPRYFLHLVDRAIVRDDVGMEFEDAHQAREEAIRSARDIMADQVRQGRLSLRDRIEVEDETGKAVLTLSFRDAVQLQE